MLTETNVFCLLTTTEKLISWHRPGVVYLFLANHSLTVQSCIPQKQNKIKKNIIYRKLGSVKHNFSHARARVRLQTGNKLLRTVYSRLDETTWLLCKTYSKSTWLGAQYEF